MRSRENGAALACATIAVLPLSLPAMRMSNPSSARARVPARDELLVLRNIGPAMRRDFALLGIGSVRRLARCHPDRLYAKLERLTGQRQDPCVRDTFAAAIHQARTGEALPWWHFSRIRKRAAQAARAAQRARGRAARA